MIKLGLLLLIIATGSAAGYSSRLLTLSGAVAAFFVGGLVVLGLGINGLIILGLFFASSSFWSKIKSSKKKKAEELLVKGSQRDWQQVLANGGLAALTGLMYYLTDQSIWLLGFCVTIAAANSDTWASEIGSMSRGKPFFIKTLKRVERGTSGAVSPLGTTAAVLGSLLIAYTSYLLLHLSITGFYFIFILGFVGNTVDTLLGAFVQVGYQCKVCGIKTEKPSHCGRDTIRIKGKPFFNNDMVNFLSGLTALLVGILIK